jgi:hypothetical protein
VHPGSSRSHSIQFSLINAVVTSTQITVLYKLGLHVFLYVKIVALHKGTVFSMLAMNSDTDNTNNFPLKYQQAIINVTAIVTPNSGPKDIVLKTIIIISNRGRLCGLVVRVPGYRTEMCCASCEVRTEVTLCRRK